MNNSKQNLAGSILLFFLVVGYSGNLQAGIATTPHNLSVSGAGTIHAASEDRICIFCHITHNALPIAPLWNRASSGAIYTPYNSSTIVGAPGQPTGSSILCLSCHDGTIALGDVASGDAIQMTGGVTNMPAGSNGLLGTNLADDHPVSFVFSQAISTTRGDLVNPTALTGAVKLDDTGRVQCTTCHNPHSDTFDKFLVLDNRGAALCETCHKKTNWPNSPHKTSVATWNGVAPNPWPNTEYTNVADNACQSCHMPHTAVHSERLLTYVNEEDTCTVCHNGNVSSDVLTDFRKQSSHPLSQTTGVHQPNEPVLVTDLHVECSDCHNPHSQGRVINVAGLNGIDISNTPVTPITNTYQLCFRCHGDSPDISPPLTSRQVPTINNNIRLMFSPGNPSFHSVAAVGIPIGPVPSLIPPLTATSRMGCNSCHGNDRGEWAPHGSTFSPILQMQNITTDRTNESAAAYALCYSCHDRNSILSDNTFREHSRHIQGENAPCNVCHDPHGVSATNGGTARFNSRLINFDTNVVTPNNGVLQLDFQDGNGTCTLVCHGDTHNAEPIR
jgi:predicted CXXCH cytochrome family protein